MRENLKTKKGNIAKKPNKFSKKSFMPEIFILIKTGPNWTRTPGICERGGGKLNLQNNWATVVVEFGADHRDGRVEDPMFSD